MAKFGRFRLLILTIALASATGTFGLEGAARKRRRRPAPTPTVTSTPTPVPFQRAAGSCVRYEPSHYIIVAELGQAGRSFRIDEGTVIRVISLRIGSRVRILLEDSPDGPVARRILPGPEPAK